MKKNLFKTIAAVSTVAMVAAMPVLAEAKTYIIATDTTFPPFDIPTADGEMEGIDMDILAAIAEDQGFEYEVQALGFDAALLAVQTGQADGVIAGRRDRQTV